jgi:hypothetical protein
MVSEVINSSHLNWEPTVLEGVTIHGVYAKNLRFDQNKRRPLRLLLKFDAGAAYPTHNFPGGDEIFILEGDVKYGQFELKTGDYLVTPPDANLSVSSKNGCIMLYIMSK